MALGRITVDGGEIHYEIAGTGSPVVLLHPGALSSRTWDREFELLTAEHTVVRYDARNHGQSSTATEPYANHDDLRLLLDGLGIDRASLVGMSLGSRTSVDFALAWPDRVDRLMLNSPGVSGMTFKDPFILDQLERLQAAQSVEDVVDALLRMWVDGPHRAPGQVDPEVRARCERIKTDTVSRHGTGWRIRPVEVGAIDRLAELAMPITVVLADLDSPDIADVVERIVGDAKRAELVTVSDAGHIVNLEQPERFAEILLKSV
ncbi:alpha/beta fold hydrolase [Kutzneria kofuensis]|uniref:Pimeloyl-ACP methyl ester carboxylesterase n=1 Tax=Kutzneria kofuensis TaxID=103725 RepID=A0A7W9KNZ8_9PSEU|nr:alpha/beta hydrolase [Kutzneria kofuensis]MBB5895788.1 pimeloyl-ACP methyl ester carboxylesterase [Kutzneria kofuensis]